MKPSQQLHRPRDEHYYNDLMAVYFHLLDIPSNNPIGWFGIQCGVGWDALLTDMLEKIEFEYRKMNQRDQHAFKIVQIKEKFGTLRVYTSNSNDAIRDIIHAAENTSIDTCESCGKPGILRHGNYVQVQCDACVEKEIRCLKLVTYLRPNLT